MKLEAILADLRENCLNGTWKMSMWWIHNDSMGGLACLQNKVYEMDGWVSQEPLVVKSLAGE